MGPFNEGIEYVIPIALIIPYLYFYLEYTTFIILRTYNL
jgi:hypothetical protein